MVLHQQTRAASRLLEKHFSPSKTSCPRCLVRKAITCFELQRRKYASLSSFTAVNANPAIPVRLRELHGALNAVRKDAAAHVNLSRLNLALHGLETEAAVTRIAEVLGLKDQFAARQLARLLLADPLSKEQAWEKLLERYNAQTNRSLIIRYGDKDEPQPSNSIVDTLSIPSQFLQEHNLELLVSSLNVDIRSPSGSLEHRNLKDSALLPTAEAVRAFDGAVSFITYPVHRALALGDGIGGLLVLGRYATSQTGSSNSSRELFTAAVNIDVPTSGLALPTSDNVPEILILNAKAGLHAIEAYRENKANAKVFQEGWFASGMPLLNEWLLGPQASSAELQPSLFNLITDILEEALASLTKAEQAETQTSLPFSQGQPYEKTFDLAITEWASQSHSELQEGMERAFDSINWSKFRWWKLPIRADDISALLSDILERKWLCESEKHIMYLAGRCREAGLLPEGNLLVSKPSVIGKEFSNNPNDNIAGDSRVPVSEVWPVLITERRLELVTTTVPLLESLAQKLLVQTLSGFTLSVGTSAFIYIASSSVTAFEAASFAALGIVWSLRRMQKHWEQARASWQRKILEAGRAVLKATEAGMRMAVMKRPSQNACHTQNMFLDRKSRDILEEARRALSKLH